MLDLKKWLKHEKDDFENDVEIYPKRRLLILLLLLLALGVVFFRLWQSVSYGSLITIDSQIAEIISHYRNPVLDTLLFSITVLGSQYFLILVITILSIPLFIKHRKKMAVIVFITLILGILLVVFLKDILGRIRPTGCYPALWGADCYSFPSGHAAISFYLYGIIYYLTVRLVKMRKRLSLIFGTLILFLISLISISRIYFGFHYFSDVVAGFLLGGICWIAAAILIDILYREYY